MRTRKIIKATVYQYSKYSMIIAAKMVSGKKYYSAWNVAKMVTTIRTGLFICRLSHVKEYDD